MLSDEIKKAQQILHEKVLKVRLNYQNMYNNINKS